MDGGRTESKGLFLCYAADEHFIAVNNERGQRWREEFKTEQTARLWLNGHMVLNMNNELCNGLTGEKDPDIAEKVRAELGRRKK